MNAVGSMEQTEHATLGMMGIQTSARCRIAQCAQLSKRLTGCIILVRTSPGAVVEGEGAQTKKLFF